VGSEEARDALRGRCRGHGQAVEPVAAIPAAQPSVVSSLSVAAQRLALPPRSVTIWSMFKLPLWHGLVGPSPDGHLIFLIRQSMNEPPEVRHCGPFHTREDAVGHGLVARLNAKGDASQRDIEDALYMAELSYFDSVES
jgi:hypothetical protein